MAQRIDVDKSRFNSIVRGKVRKDLKTYVSKIDLFGRKGKNIVSIPIPQIVPPRFRFGPNTPNIGQGNGDPLDTGDVLGDGPGAGNTPGEHILEVDFTIEELAEMMGEELELPHLEPKGKKNLRS